MRMRCLSSSTVLLMPFAVELKSWDGCCWGGGRRMVVCVMGICGGVGTCRLYSVWGPAERVRGSGWLDRCGCFRC